MIRVTYKYLVTTINKKITQDKHSHEITWFRNRIAVWSSLHKLALIYESSHWSVFESPVYRIHNEHKIKIEFVSPVTGFRAYEQIYKHLLAIVIRKRHRNNTHLAYQASHFQLEESTLNKFELEFIEFYIYRILYEISYIFSILN